jgi:hypothetical protein
VASASFWNVADLVAGLTFPPAALLVSAIELPSSEWFPDSLHYPL